MQFILKRMKRVYDEWDGVRIEKKDKNYKDEREDDYDAFLY